MFLPPITREHSGAAIKKQNNISAKRKSVIPVMKINTGKYEFRSRNHFSSSISTLSNQTSPCADQNERLTFGGPDFAP